MLVLPVYDLLLLPGVTFNFKKDVLERMQVEKVEKGEEILFLIQKEEKRKLSEIIEQEGPERFKEIENRVNASVQVSDTVIAPGGSVIYCEEAMQHLKSIGKVVYLKLSLDSLSKRLGNLKGRGVLLKDGQTLSDLYEERVPLYEKYADLVVDEEGKNLEESLEAVLEIIHISGK